MSFVKVKDHEWLDLEKGLECAVFKADNTLSTLYVINKNLRSEQREYYFETLAEALTAAEKIIESCEGTFTYDPGHYYPLRIKSPLMKMEG